MSISYLKDIDYARGRLTGTFVVYKKSLVFVVDVARGKAPTFAYVNRPDEGEDIKEGLLKDVDLTPIKLGYSNTGVVAKYLMRKPSRRWKQGVDKGGVVAQSTFGLGFIGVGTKDLKFVHKGHYPSLEEATNRAKEGGGVVAFSRTFAITAKGEIEYKGAHIVGDMVGGVRTVLNKEFLWLGEALRDA
ncbi:MAG: hypothetical protein GQ574_14755 [Crocinitomix sp.]|nr:hypothetical protein [Crocinitomix sp.]